MTLRFDRPTGLMFHHFHGAGHPVTQGSIGADTFERILDFAGQQNRILSAGDWLAKAKAGTLGADDSCITFDDALACQYDVARPVLDRRSLTAFWFVYTSVLDGGIEPLEIFRLFRTTCFADIDAFYELFSAEIERTAPERYARAKATFDPADYLKHAPFYTEGDRWFRYLRDVVLTFGEYQDVMERMMEAAGFSVEAASRNLWLSKDQVRELDRNGHVIGLHSHTHPTTMAKLPEDEQRREYRQNSDDLTALLGRRPEVVSHPCNSYGPETLAILSSLGVTVGFRANIAPVERRGPLEFAREDHANICRLLASEDGVRS